jgi:hypothetical protein
MTYRVDQSRGEHDFNLSYLDGSISAVEVTSSVDEAIEHAYARIRDTRKGGPMVKTKLCENDWLVHPALCADLRMVRAKVDQYLAAVEFAGIDRFWAPTDLHPSVERIYQNLGVVSGSVFSHWKEPGQIGIMFPTRGGAFKRAAAAIEAAEKEAFKVDNRRKLGLSGTNERHLVVYVYPTH